MTEGILRWRAQSDATNRDEPAEPSARATTGGGDGAGVGPVCVGEVEGVLRAELARTYLEQAGISVFLQGEPMTNVYGIVSGPLGVVRLFVPAAQAEEATRVFAELDFSDEPAPEN
jgi:hypothetical protein